MKRNPPPSPRPVIDGLTRLAAVIQDHFKTPCSKQSIKYWQRKNPPFPAPTAANRYDQEACFAWVETHIISKNDKTGQGDLFRKAQESEARLKITKDENAAFDFEIKQGNYIERSIVKNTLIGALQKAHSFVRSEIEANGPADRRDKLIALGVTQEAITLFHAWDILQEQSRIDRIETSYAQAGSNGL